MNALARNALNAYSQVGVEVGITNASPHRLILMLFDGAIKSVSMARIHMNNNDIAPKCESIAKAIAIVDQGLKISLDVKAGGELAENLFSLYEYICHRLLMANLKNDVSMLDEVEKLLIGLRDAWAQIEKPAKAQGETASAPAQLQEADALISKAVTSYGKV